VVERMQKFSADGKDFLGSFGRAGTGPGEFNRPEGLCADARDRIYVADSCNHRIQVFDRDGKFLREFAKAGAVAGELSYPYDVCVDAAGRVYVCEFGNSRIQIFDAQGKSLEILGGPGAAPGRFANPWSVALDSKGNLYVADSQNHRVQKFIRKTSGAGAQNRTPSAKIRKHAEARNPKGLWKGAVSYAGNAEWLGQIFRRDIGSNSGSASDLLRLPRSSFGDRNSDFGLPSDFGFRISDFLFPAVPAVCS
jgi:DNA-binding beta-propeller fold protein YncE